MSDSRRGLAALIASYAIWGLFPVYWKPLGQIAAAELLYGRLILTALACLLLLPLRGTWPDFRAAWSRPAVLGRCLASAVLLSANWFAFIWAVNAGKVLESSLGYFLCPIVSIVLGWFVEKERLRWNQWLAVALAAGGVTVMIAQAGTIPLAAIVIALTWGSYGLIKKRSRLGPIVGLGLEASLLSPPAAAMLAWIAWSGTLTLGAADGGALALFSFAGILTATPLLLFSYAATRTRLSTAGMGQYMVPTAHFGLAFYYGEPVTSGVLAGFGLIWAGLVVYSVPGRWLGGAAESR